MLMEMIEHLFPNEGIRLDGEFVVNKEKVHMLDYGVHWFEFLFMYLLKELCLKDGYEHVVNDPNYLDGSPYEEVILDYMRPEYVHPIESTYKLFKEFVVRAEYKKANPSFKI